MLDVQMRVAEENRQQLVKQTTDTLELQRLVTNRAAASFVADKRQKWIDELRTDMATHLAQSQEILWKWDAVRSKAEHLKASGNLAPTALAAKTQEAADEHSKENGQRDYQHQERHIRIRFRLNPKEDSHIKLRGYLDEIRALLSQTQMAQEREAALAVIRRMQVLINIASDLTQEILKTEWTRVKQEVAYPDMLLSKIPVPPLP
ncbi:hypothetical protein LJR034_000918 [Caballeronia sp. LjRoot34]|uniref:hypothetical protein n=1 Tax=Caballeronia sp. LjRoot34 TaxID=3342325 RepID=UPI003ECCE330